MFSGVSPTREASTVSGDIGKNIGGHRKRVIPDSKMATRSCFESLKMPPKAIAVSLFVWDLERALKAMGMFEDGISHPSDDSN